MDIKDKRTLHIIILVGIIIIVLLALILGLVFGLKKDKDKDSHTEEEEIDVLNLYNNTEELIKEFPVLNPTTVKPGIEEKIQNRLLTGFVNWNRGFKTWKAWGNILYTPESIYNVHGARLSLAHYQEAMDLSLKQANILMGDFHNMLITDEFCAIHYDFITVIKDGTKKKGKVMEFVQFADYGEELGTRVVEGWGSTKDYSYDGLTHFQGDEEKAVQSEQLKYMMEYKLPNTTDLKKKYIVKSHTDFIDSNGEEIFEIILQGFDSWNTGINEYLVWQKNAYDENATSSGLNETERTMTQYIEEMISLSEKYSITKLYFDNVLIRENWAALHYRFRRNDLETNEIYVGDRMQFLKFEKKEDGLKIIASWIQ